MEESQEELFKCMSVGIMLRLGFQALLTEAARLQGRDAARWLDDFETRVIADTHKMSADETVPERIVFETIDAAVAEFRQAFTEARARISADPPRRRHRQRPPTKRSAGRHRRCARPRARQLP